MGKHGSQWNIKTEHEKRAVYLEMEMKKNDHFSITRLENGVLDIVVQNIHFISTDGIVAESVGMRFQGT